MADENTARTRAECAHTWEIVTSVWRRCQKCQLPWETWAEERITSLESRLDAIEAAVGGDELDVAFITLLPPQTEYTCPTCNGIGQTAFGEYSLVCSICSCPQQFDYVEKLGPESFLTCGHGAQSLAAVNYCLDCDGTGTIRR